MLFKSILVFILFKFKKKLTNISVIWVVQLLMEMVNVNVVSSKVLLDSRVSCHIYAKM